MVDVLRIWRSYRKIIGALLLTGLLKIALDRINSIRNKNLTVLRQRNKFPKTVLDDAVFRHINVAEESGCTGRKFLVYTCGHCCCGGWGDRQKGIISGFLLAVFTNRSFVIDMSQPCDLDKILSPSLYRWDTCRKYIYTKTAGDRKLAHLTKIDHKLSVKINYGNSSLQELLVIKEDILAVHIRSLILDEIKQQYQSRIALPWIYKHSDEKVIHIVLHTLFSYKSLITKENFDQNVETLLQRKLACGHIRLGNSPTMPGDYFKRLISPFKLNLLSNFFKNFSDASDSPKYAVYIATDNDKVRLNMFQHFSNIVPLNITAVHIDYPVGDRISEEACAGMRNALLEQWILSTCDVLVLTRSNFGAMAAYMRGGSENLFLLKPNMNRIIPADLGDIQKIFYFN